MMKALIQKAKLGLFNATAAQKLARPVAGSIDLDSEAIKKGPLVVAGYFKTASGIGKTAHLTAAHLKAQGHNPICVDLSEMFHQVDMESPYALSPMPDVREGTMILHVNAPITTRALWRLGMTGAKKWRIAGYWAWELPVLPEEWMKAQEFLSEIWVPSKFVESGFQGRDKIPVRVEPYNVKVPSAVVTQHEKFALNKDHFTILSMADSKSSLHRKNISGSIQAFLKAFPANGSANVQMLLKLRNCSATEVATLKDQAGHDPRIKILNKTLDYQEQFELIATCDVFLSLHRAEGFGLVMVEALAMGKYVIATNWSGGDALRAHQHFIPVPYDLETVRDDVMYESDQKWAAPDIDHAAQELWAKYAMTKE